MYSQPVYLFTSVIKYIDLNIITIDWRLQGRGGVSFLMATVIGGLRPSLTSSPKPLATIVGGEGVGRRLGHI